MPIIGNRDLIPPNSVETIDIQDAAVTLPKLGSDISLGPVGSGNDRVFQLFDKVVSANYTIPANKNAGTAGPVTIADGVTVTVPDGVTWTVV